MNFCRENIKELDDKELMALIVGGDEKAFETIYDRYKKRLYYFFLRMLGNCEETANDFLQELFIKIIDKPHLYQSDFSFSTWIFSIANNMCKNEYRKRQIREYISIDYVEHKVEHEDTLKTKIKSEEKIDFLMKEIDNLNNEFKTVMLLKYKENFCLKEISKITGVPEGTVKSRLYYARKELSKRLSFFNS